jgi:hypothetical protein
MSAIDASARTRLRSDRDRDGPVGPRPSGRDEEREQLIERIRASRAERGLSPEAPGLEIDGPQLEPAADVAADPRASRASEKYGDAVHWPVRVGLAPDRLAQRE